MDDIVKVDVIRTTGLARLDAATQALAKATGIQEIKKIRDVAEAVRKLAKTAGAGLDIQNEGAMLKIRAERKCGEKLKVMEKARGGQPYQKATSDTVSPVEPTVKEAKAIAREKGTEKQFEAANTRLLERRARIAGNRSEPQHIGKIIPDVLSDIESRTQREILV